LQAIQIQGLFAPLVGILAGAALLLLWRYNRHIRYLPYFGMSLFCFATGVVLSQILVERMTVPNALFSSTMFYAATGFMVHGALMRKGAGLNIPLHLLMMGVDIIGRILILYFDQPSSVYVIYANTMLGAPLALGAYRLTLLANRDIQSVSVAVAFGFIAVCLIFVTPFAVFIGEQVTGENYYSSYYWVMLSILTVVGTFLLILSFGFTLGTDLLRAEKVKDQHIENTMHDIRQPLHALRLKMHQMMQVSKEASNGYEDVSHTFGYLEELVSNHLADGGNTEVIKPTSKLTSDEILTSVYEMFLPDAEAKGIKFEYQKSTHQVDVDDLVLMRITSNLVSNAIKYTQKGKVTFGLKKVDGQIRLEVHDTGVGMTAKAFKQVLKRNVRLKEGAEQAEGNGYGLAIIKALSDEHQLALSLMPTKKKGTGIMIGF